MAQRQQYGFRHAFYGLKDFLVMGALDPFLETIRDAQPRP
jgi:hypothetical protein